MSDGAVTSSRVNQVTQHTTPFFTSTTQLSTSLHWYNVAWLTLNCQASTVSIQGKLGFLTGGKRDVPRQILKNGGSANLLFISRISPFVTVCLFSSGFIVLQQSFSVVSLIVFSECQRCGKCNSTGVALQEALLKYLTALSRHRIQLARYKNPLYSST